MAPSRTRNAAYTLISALERSPDHVAILCDGARLSRHELATCIRIRAAAFQDVGVEATQACVILSGRGADFWIDFIALWAIGAVAVPLEPTLSDAHGAEVARCVAPSFISCGDQAVPAAFGELVKIPPFDPDADRPPPGPWWTTVAPVASDDLAAVLFTSGTTGMPKGVRVRHEMLVLNALGALSVLGLTPSDRLLFAIPFRFISSISHVLVTLLSGATLLCTERTLLAKDLIELLQSTESTAFGGAPLQLRFVAHSGPDVLPHLRWVMSSGDHLPSSVIADLLARFPGLRINAVYGLTELAGRFCALPPDEIERHPGSVGRPIPGLSLKVLDEQGACCEPGAIGQVIVEGMAVFDGYQGNRKATDEALGPEGFKTGDLGYLDEAKRLFLSGRTDSVFKRSGQKVSTLPISDALLASEQFEDVAVVAIPDEIQGHVPVVYYVTKAGVPFDKGTVQAALRKSLPGNSLPAAYHAIEQVPRTGSGKIDRRRLAALIAELG